MTKLIKKTFHFRKTKENGELAGTEMEMEVPEFNWDEFVNLPNARLFAEKTYHSVLQKLVRDISLGKNGTKSQDIQSIESVIRRSITFSKREVQDWCKTRDWGLVQFKVDACEAIAYLEDKLPLFAVDEYPIRNEDLRNRIAEIIAQVADSDEDPIADYLWVKLTEKLVQEDELMDLF